MKADVTRVSFMGGVSRFTLEVEAADDLTMEALHTAGRRREQIEIHIVPPPQRKEATDAGT